MTALFSSLLVLLLLAVVAVLGIAYVLLRKRPGPRVGGVVAFTRVAACIGVVIVAVPTLSGLAASLLGDGMVIQVPVEPYWPQYTNITDVTPDHGDAVQREITSVTVTASNLSAATRGFLAAGSVVSGLATVAVLAAVVVLCSKLLAAKPFGDSLRHMGRLASGALAFGTLIGQTLTGIGTYRAGEETLRVDGYTMTGDQVLQENSPWPIPEFSINYEFAPLFMALAILVVVELVSAGMMMARQNERLRADTEGLI